MAGQLIPPPEFSPPPLDKLTAEQALRIWADLYEAGEQLLLAGFRHEAGPEGDPASAFRRWFGRQTQDHDRALVHMLERFGRSGVNLGL